MLSDIKRYRILCFGFHPWSTMWKRNQSMMYHISRERSVGKVLFINPEVRLSDLIFYPKDSLLGLRKFSWRAVVPKKITPKLTVFTPLHAIFCSRRARFLSRLDYRLLTWSIKILLASKEYVLFINNPRWEADTLIKCFVDGAALTVFDMSDDFIEFFNEDDEVKRTLMKRMCNSYMRISDLVITVNERLAERATGIARRVHAVFNATDYENLSRASRSRELLPSKLTSLKRPIIGYTGWIVKNRIDQEVLDHLVAKRPDWTLLFIGPTDGAIRRRYEEYSNVVFLPAVSYRKLPDYMRAFDVCFIPHVVNRHTNGNDPIKLYDYLATGKPVVTSEIAGVDRVRDVVRVAHDKEDFVSLIERALEDDGSLRAQRMSKARENQWSHRAKEVMRLLAICGEKAPQGGIL